MDNMKPLKIYIAGPLNADAVNYIKNVSRMLKIAIAIRKKGHYPYVPALDILLGFVAGDWEYQDYFELNKAFLSCCDALFFIAPSPGASKELKLARELGLKIFYDIKEIPKIQ